MQPPIENIALIRAQKNLSREQVAKKLKVTVSLYGKLERGEIGLTLERLYELAAIFNVKPEEILTLAKSRQGNAIYVPLEEQSHFLTGGSRKDTRNYSVYHLPFIDGEKLFIIHATTDCMYPTIQPGDRLVIEQVTRRGQGIKYGMVYVVVTKAGAFIGRIHSHNNRKKLVLKSDNPLYEPYEMAREDVKAFWPVKNYLLTNLTPRYLPQLGPKMKGKISKIS